MLPPATLPELLLARATHASDSARITFLDMDGNVSNSMSYADLLRDASVLALRLLASGLTRDDIVLASFMDHEHHIRLFWACCLAGIRICPLPVPHPDPSRQAMLFNHLQTLFHRPTLITSVEGVENARVIVPWLRAFTLKDLPAGLGDTSGVFPERCPLPSDTVCFMLTSGSTGNSKVVTLRHSNLLSSIRGKIRHHSSVSTSRFFNWIAFDHVACISEIHLHALEVDASQWHVTPAAVIRNPCNLLAWISTFKITYTFSPNFLLAQILRDITSTSIVKPLDLSNLRALISGGEAVPLSTAIAFADLVESHGGERNVLRAGFGMSETGAGCIYDTRAIPTQDEPIAGKYLSVGNCCKGVEMRVVDAQTGKVCSTGETGQLQTKGPTVFTEYYSNERATQDAFTRDGWFITGDMARVDVDGNLFLVGRDKDCININGVKYPTQDLEHLIEDAKIDGVVQSYVYVCPMRLVEADTETYGVFYQHCIAIDVGLDKAQKQAVDAASQGIKTVCTMFVSKTPHVVLPLPRASFLKTALGKVSRSQLAKAYLQGDFQTIQTTLEAERNEDGKRDSDLVTQIERTVAASIALIFHFEPSTLRRSQNIFEIGASSMHLLRLKQALQNHLSLPEIPTIEMLKRPEIGALCDYLSALSKSRTRGEISQAVKYHPLVCFTGKGTKPPVFLVHPGVGEVLVFVALAKALADDRPVYALRARGFDSGESLFESFKEMIDTYTSAIEVQHPSGPYYIAGYSFGGAVAFEIGKQLETRGKKVKWIGILNLPPHIQFRMNELTWGEVLLNIGMFLSLIPSDSMGAVRKEINEKFPSLAAGDAEPLNPQEPIEWIFTKSDKARLAELNLEIGAFTRWVKVAYELNRTGRSFEPRGCVRNALTTVFCAVPLPSMGTRQEYKRDRLAMWQEFSGERFEMVDVEGEHYTMLSEIHITSFAGKMRDALKRADGNSATTRVDFDRVPIIDFSLSRSDPDKYFAELQFVLEDVGFGVFVNVPGFDSRFQHELFELSEQLFGKPQQWKDSLGTAKSPALRGYLRADTIPGVHKAYAEAFRFGADTPAPGALDDPTVPFWLKLHEGPNQWPPEEQLPHFRAKMETLFHRYHALNLELNSHICRLLAIPDQVLKDFFPNKTEFNSAIWHYFPVTPEIMLQAKDGFVQGMHEHRDPSTFLTCLIQSRAGLQVQNHQGAWIDIPMVEGGVVCNIGMQLMKFTGGRLVATTHRVNTLKIDKDRFTIPYVLSTRLDKEVVPLTKFASPESAKAHSAPNPQISKLMAIDDPLIRSGYARLSLFPAATQQLYPQQFEEARRMGIV